MAREIHELVGLVTSKVSGFIRGMKQAETATRRFRKAWADAAKAVGRSAQRIAIAATVAVGGAAKAFASFEKQMVKVGIVTQTLGTRDFKMLEQAALEMGKRTQFTAVQAAQALEELGLQGFNTRQSIAALPKVLQLATAANIDIAQAALMAGKTMNGFRFEVEDLDRVNNALVGGFQNAAINVREVFEGLSKASAAASVMGESIEDTIAIIGRMVSANVDASIAGTALRNAFKSLAAPTKEGRRIMEELNIRAGMPMIEILRILENRVLKLGDAQKSLNTFINLFGVRGGPQMLAGLSKGVKSIDEYAAAIRRAVKQNVALGAQAAMVNTLSGKWAILKSNVMDLVIGVGRRLMPVLMETNEVFDRFVSEQKTRLIDAISAGLRRFVVMVREVGKWMRDAGPAIIEVAKAWAAMLVPILEYLAKHPTLLAALVALKIAGMLGLTTAVVALTKALVATIALLVSLAMKAGAAKTAMVALKVAAFAVFGGAVLLPMVQKLNAEFDRMKVALDSITRSIGRLVKVQDRMFKRKIAEAENKNIEERLRLLKLLERQQRQIVEARRFDIDKTKTAIQKRGDARGMFAGAGAMIFGDAEMDRLKALVKENQALQDAARRRLELVRKAIEQTMDDAKNAAQAVANPGRGRGGRNAAAVLALDAEEVMRRQMAAQFGAGGKAGKDEKERQREAAREAVRQSRVEMINRRTPGFGSLRQIAGMEGIHGGQFAQILANQGVPAGAAGKIGQSFGQVQATGSVQQMDVFIEKVVRYMAAVKRLTEAKKEATNFANTFGKHLIQLRQDGSLSKDAIEQFRQRAIKLRDQMKAGKMSMDEFTKATRELRKETDKAVAAEKRRRILRGDFRHLDPRKALEDRLFDLRMQQWNRGIDNMFNRMMGFNRVVAPVQQQFQRLHGAMGRFGQQLNNVFPDRQQIQQAVEGLGRAFADRGFQIANLRNEITFARQRMALAGTARRRLAIGEQIQALQNRINQLSQAPPPTFVATSRAVDPGDPGLQMGVGGVTVQVTEAMTPDAISQLVDRVQDELHRRGKVS